MVVQISPKHTHGGLRFLASVPRLGGVVLWELRCLHCGVPNDNKSREKVDLQHTTLHVMIQDLV